MAHLVKKRENFDLMAPVLPEGFKVEGSGFKIPQDVSPAHLIHMFRSARGPRRPFRKQQRERDTRATLA